MTPALNIGFLLFPRLTQLDFTGPFEVLSRLPGTMVRTLWKEAGPVRADTGLTVLADTVVRAHDLDEAAAIKAKEEAERILANRSEAMSVAEAQAQLAQAMAQLQALERLRRNLKH